MKKLSARDFRIGDKVYCKDRSGSDTGVVNGIKKRVIQIKYTEHNEGRWYGFENSTIKPILRRLEDMTGEETAEEFRIKCECNKEIHSAAASSDGFKIREKQVELVAAMVDFRDSIGIDQRGWIDAGLAVDAKEVEDV